MGELKNKARSTDRQPNPLSPEKKRRILHFLKEALPPGEPRISTPMDVECEVSVVIPAYAERQMILRPLESLIRQTGIEKKQFEVIIVVNNPEEVPERLAVDSEADYQKKIELYQRALQENQEVLRLVQLIQGQQVELDVSAVEVEAIQRIRDSGLRVFAVDKASKGHTLPQEQATVGGARNRGVAEAIERFYSQAKKNGIIVQTDADVRLDEAYLSGAITLFAERPKVVGVSGKSDFELPWGDPFYLKTTLYSDLLRKYELLLRATYEDPSGKKLQKSISFGGANMASRAYETALIGGVPKLYAGEDTAFGEKLKDEGEVMLTPELVAHPADRYSMRTSGHGYERIKMQEQLDGSEEIQVLNPRYSEYIKQLNARLVEALDHPPVKAEILKSIFSYADRPLIEPEELQKLMAKITPETSLDDFKTDPVKYQLVSTVVTRLKQRIGTVPLHQGLAGLKERLLGGGAINSRFESSKQAFLLEERRNIEYRRWFIKQFVQLLFERKLVPPTGETIIRLLLEQQKELAIPEEKLKHITQETRGIQRAVDTLSDVHTPEEATQKMLVEYQPELTPPEERPELMTMLELKALFSVMTTE